MFLGCLFVNVIAIVLSVLIFILHLENQVESLFMCIVLVFVFVFVCGVHGCVICILCNFCLWVLWYVGHVNAVKCGG